MINFGAGLILGILIGAYIANPVLRKKINAKLLKRETKAMPTKFETDPDSALFRIKLSQFGLTIMQDASKDKPKELLAMSKILPIIIEGREFKVIAAKYKDYKEAVISGYVEIQKVSA